METKYVQHIYSKPQAAREDTTIRSALAIMEKRMTTKRDRLALKDPSTVRQFLTLKLADEPRELFMAIWLDNQHRVLATETLATGTIDGAAVYPREVIKAALAHNAAAVLFAHNHPSGVAEPSSADRALTERLKSTLALLEIRVLDHFVIGATIVSFAERGWI